jgi:trans-aconitate methyltransferase
MRSRREEIEDTNDNSPKIQKIIPKFERINKSSKSQEPRGKSNSKKLSMIKSGYEDLPDFDPPMKEFFDSNEILTKIFALSIAIKLDLFNEIFKLNKSDFTSLTEIKESLGLKINDLQFNAILEKLEFHGFLQKKGKLQNIQYKLSEKTLNNFIATSEKNYTNVYKNVERYFLKFPECIDNMKQGKIKNFLQEIYTVKEDLINFSDFYTLVNERNFTNLINRFDFSRYKTIIDINGNKADLCLKIKQRYPDVQVVSYDRAEVEPLAMKYLQENSMEEKVELMFGDIMNEALIPADVVIVPHFLQYFEMEDKKKLLKSIHSSLNPNGCIIIQENLIYQTKKEIVIPANKISLLLTFQNFEDHHLTFEEYYEILTQIGFQNVKHYHKDSISFVIVATKKEDS